MIRTPDNFRLQQGNSQIQYTSSFERSSVINSAKVAKGLATAQKLEGEIRLTQSRPVGAGYSGETESIPVGYVDIEVETNLRVNTAIIEASELSDTAVKINDSRSDELMEQMKKTTTELGSAAYSIHSTITSAGLNIVKGGAKAFGEGALSATSGSRLKEGAKSAIKSVGTSIGITQLANASQSVSSMSDRATEKPSAALSRRINESRAAITKLYTLKQSLRTLDTENSPVVGHVHKEIARAEEAYIQFQEKYNALQQDLGTLAMPLLGSS